jgi:2-hydroxychromene-2-carboxylate isomerase
MAIYAFGAVVYEKHPVDRELKYHLLELSRYIARVGFQLIFMAYDNSSGKIAVHHARVLTKYRWVRPAYGCKVGAAT